MSAIGSFAGNASPPSSSADGFSDLTSEEFLSIMFAELSNQDPLEPQDSQALLEQISSLRSIQSDLELTESLQTLVKQNEFASASVLVGQVVGGINTNGQRVLDLVISVTNTADGPILTLLDSGRIAFNNIDEILGPLIPDPGADDPDDPVDPDEPDDPGEDDPPAQRLVNAVERIGDIASDPLSAVRGATSATPSLIPRVVP